MEQISVLAAQSRTAGPTPEKFRHFALSRTTDRVLQILLRGDLSRLRAESVAEELEMSSTTLRRRLRADHTCYQFLLDRSAAVPAVSSSHARHGCPASAWQTSWVTWRSTASTAPSGAGPG